MNSKLGSNDILQDDNYFFWEFNACMALAQKDLLPHVIFKQGEVATEIGINSVGWQMADLNAFAIVFKLLSPMYQTMVRDATLAHNAWEILEMFFVCRNLHNRVELRHQLHEFKVTGGADLLKSPTQFDHLCMNIAAVGGALPDDKKFVIILSSLSADYD